MAAQSMLMSTSVNGGRALPSLQGPSGLRRTRGYRCCRRRATGTLQVCLREDPRARAVRQVQGQGRAGEEGPWLLAAWSAARTGTVLLMAAAPPRVNPLLYVRTGCCAQA